MVHLRKHMYENCKIKVNEVNVYMAIVTSAKYGYR